MNNFPAMTEEKRQELIRHNRAKLNAITPQFLKESVPVVKKHLQHEIDSAKIAIAALTADTSKLAELAAKVRKVREDAADFDGDRRGMWEYQEEQEQLLLAEAVKYTALPEPVLRVPDGWIKCSERYPAPHEWVLVYAKWANQQVICWDHVTSKWTDFYEQNYHKEMFSHWQPLPSPPETSNEQ